MKLWLSTLLLFRSSAFRVVEEHVAEERVLVGLEANYTPTWPHLTAPKHISFLTRRRKQNHTFGQCQCARTSGNRNSCCAKGNLAGMGTGTFCGSATHGNHCGRELPVCCTSATTSMCCPNGSGCTIGCKMGGKAFGTCGCLPQPPETSAQEQYRPALAVAFAAMSNVAYCGPEFAGYETFKNFTCENECSESGLRLEPGSMRQLVRHDRGQKNASFAWAARFATDTVQPLEGMPRAGDCVIAFRGTVNLANWLRNFQMNKNDFDIEEWSHHSNPAFTFGRAESKKSKKAKKPKVHVGIHRVWEKLRARVGWQGQLDEAGALGLLRELGCGPGSGRRVFPTGHSLGGGLAILAMWELRRAQFDVGQTYVMNTPRIGNKVFAKAFNAIMGREVPLFRITHRRDPIPRSGFSAQGYRHVGAEAYYYPDWPDNDLSKSYVVCEDPESKLCQKRFSVGSTLNTAGGEDHCTIPLGPPGKRILPICTPPDYCLEAPRL